MDKNLYTEDIEDLLKENADQFKMQPSKKVWHGIYNDLHPGKRWPSFAMSIFFIFTLVIIGHLNTQQLKHTNKASLPNQKTNSLAVNKNSVKSSNKILNRNKYHLAFNNISKQSNLNSPKFLNNIASSENPVAKETIPENKDPESAKIEISDHKKQMDNVSTNNIAERRNGNRSDADLTLNTISDSKSTKTSNQNFIKEINSKTNGENETPTIALIPNNNNSKLDVKNNTTITDTNTNVLNPSINKNLIANKEKQPVISTNIFHNFRHKSPKVSWAYYFTPAVSYRVIRNNNIAGNINDYINQRASKGFEVGTEMKYTFAKQFKFTTGIQLNYSSYRIYANNIHPVLSSLALNSAIGNRYFVNDISFFANGSGYSPTNLTNYTFQASVPVGLEYIIAGNNYVKFSAAANLQPSYIFANRSYLLSADKRNYLTQPSLLRHMNIGSSAGLLITFSSKLLDLQVGPQVRYQLLSTYKSEYPVSEHLIDYGIKFSVSKTIK